ncbi:MAG: SAM-dependent methyltransferase [Halodesulfurarchaeum sp.]
MGRKDHYYNKSKQEGYRSRSAYKLAQLDEAADLLHPGETVVDLGAAPGGWLQVAAERVGPSGRVIGVDRSRIEPLDEHEVELIRGDLTAAETRGELRETVDGPVDLVVSDMAPNVSGEYSVDHARSVHLARIALDIARDLLGAGGDLAVKVFDGRDLDAFREDVEDAFEYARTVRPDATRDSSSEVYIVGKGRLTAPVEVGERLSVTIEDTGSEGDGIARVDGYTLFVPGLQVGETATVEVTDLKARFGFAEPVD